METISDLASYLFSTAPGSSFSYYTEFTIYYGLLVLLSIVISRLVRRARKAQNIAAKLLFRKSSRHIFYISAVGFITLIFRFENIPIFAMRIIFFLVFALSIWIVLKNLYTFVMIYPKQKVERVSQPEDNTYEKYLPKKKHGKKRR